jgi:hypothetical protein
MALEAEALALYLKGETGPRGNGTILQIYRDDEAGRVSAEAFRSALKKHGIAGLRDRRIGKDEALTPEFWAGVSRTERPFAAVLWLRAPGPDGLGLPDDPGFIPGRLYLPSVLADGKSIRLPESSKDRIYLLHPFSLPAEKERRLARGKAWLRNRGLKEGDERLQVNTLFTAALAMEALDHMLGNFSRDYFMEWVEHQAEDALTPSAYPRIALGPGQRYGSKGCYILSYSSDSKDWSTPVNGWIVPER